VLLKEVDLEQYGPPQPLRQQIPEQQPGQKKYSKNKRILILAETKL